MAKNRYGLYRQLPQTKEVAARELDIIFRDPFHPYHDSTHRLHSQARRRVAKLFKIRSGRITIPDRDEALFATGFAFGRGEAQVG